MDLKLLDPVITLLTWIGHAIVYAGAGIFLLIAGWCFVMESIAVLSVVLKAVLEYARKRTAHARDALRDVRAEIHSWNAAEGRERPGRDTPRHRGREC